MGLSHRVRRHVVLQNHAKCIQSIYTEEIGAATVCDVNGQMTVSSVRQPGGVADIEVVQRQPSSAHLMLQLAQVRTFFLFFKRLFIGSLYWSRSKYT